jgi:hypothetical protein
MILSLVKNAYRNTYTECFCVLVIADCQYTGVTGYNPARYMNVGPHLFYSPMSSFDSTTAALTKSPLTQSQRMLRQ